MKGKANWLEASSAIRSDHGAIFVSMELSRSIWLTTSRCGTRGRDNLRLGGTLSDVHERDFVVPI